MWYKRAKHEVRDIDPEEQWEEVEQAEKVFQVSNIRCSREKSIRHVAVENGEVIGALSSGWCRGDSYDGKNVAVFSFDLAVDPQHRKKGVGLSLIKSAMQQYKSEKEMYADINGLSIMRIWVINPILIPVLEKLDFHLESVHERDKNGEPLSAHLIYY
jgi:GNAT superfamily N-acetyltransferase